MELGGIIVCGGKSSRMGVSKPHLPFGDETMLARVARTLGAVAEPIVVVGAPAQTLPELPREVIVRRDRRKGRGPLEGIAAGLEAVTTIQDAAYITSCDVPLLRADFVTLLWDLLDPHVDIVVPWDGEYHHPLAAIYRTRVLPTVHALLAADRLRPTLLFDEVRTRRVPASELRHVDPELLSLENLNHPRDYLAALAREGLTAPPDLLRQLREEDEEERFG